MVIPDPLTLAYRQTTYIARTPDGEIRFRLNEPESAALMRILKNVGVKEWVYVTAYNPGSDRVADDQNRTAQCRLETELTARGYQFFRGEGTGDAGDWPPEPSLLVLGMSRDDGIALGKRFGQKAIVVGQLGGSATLLWCDQPPLNTQP